MTNKKKEEQFQTELASMLSEDVKEFTKFAIGILPDYFFEIPASSSGKYHPEYALGEGGLLRHTKAAVLIAESLFGSNVITGKWNRRQKDMILSALILHDGAKSGIPKQKWTAFDHPEIVCRHIEDHCEAHGGLKLYKADRNMIYSLIRTHMGQWNKDKEGKEILDKPESPAQRFVHMCDYLASRKSIEIKFD